MKGLVVANKKQRVANYHRETVASAAEIIVAAGLCHTQELNRNHIFRRISATEIKHYGDIHPSPEPGCLLRNKAPDAFGDDLQLADSRTFLPAVYRTAGQ